MNKESSKNLKGLKKADINVREITKSGALALFIANDGETCYVRGSLKNFCELIKVYDGEYSTEKINDNIDILYNFHSSSNVHNTLINKYVKNSNIFGPAILLNKDKTDVSTNIHMKIRNLFNAIEEIGFKNNSKGINNRIHYRKKNGK